MEKWEHEEAADLVWSGSVLVDEGMLRDEVLVAQHDGFGETGGTRGEEECNKGVFGSLLVVETGPVLFAMVEEVGPFGVAVGHGLVISVEEDDVRFI